MFGFLKKNNKEEIEKAKEIVLYFDKATTKSNLKGIAEKGHRKEPFTDGTTKQIPLENGKYFKGTSTESFFKGKPAVVALDPKYPLKIFENNPDKTINQHYFYSISLLKYSIEELKNAFKIDYHNSKKRTGEKYDLIFDNKKILGILPKSFNFTKLNIGIKEYINEIQKQKK